MKTSRIPAIDGLRTFAVLGVLWSHVWGFFNNIPWKVGVDLNRIISFGRNGVDLFFVISGFCMYLMYGSRIARFSRHNFFDFLKRRWFRIAPAFYALVIIESVRLLVSDGVFPFQNFFYHLLFINIFLPKNLFSPIYWSLATEFHFYLIFPFLFLFLKSQQEFLKRVLTLILICIVFRFLLFYFHRADIAANETISGFEIWYRFAEFGFGIIGAVLFVQNRNLPGWILGARGFLAGLFIAYIGRICMLSEFLSYFGKWAFVVRTFSEPVMTFGFGLLLLSVISSPNIFSRILSWRPFLFLGKISYSMYLWHYLLAQFIASFLINRLGISLFSMNLCILISLAILIPISWVSFKIFEEPYFKKNKKAREMAYVEVF
jgi:peptidoglycan/LPS O-acetylase OafA/YrhL